MDQTTRKNLRLMTRAAFFLLVCRTETLRWFLKIPSLFWMWLRIIKEMNRAKGIEINWKTKETKSSFNGFKVFAGIYFITNSEPSHLLFPVDLPCTNLPCLPLTLPPGRQYLNIGNYFYMQFSKRENNDGNDLPLPFRCAVFCVWIGMNQH